MQIVRPNIYIFDACAHAHEEITVSCQFGILISGSFCCHIGYVHEVGKCYGRKWQQDEYIYRHYTRALSPQIAKLPPCTMLFALCTAKMLYSNYAAAFIKLTYFPSKIESKLFKLKFDFPRYKTNKIQMSDFPRCCFC